MAAPDAKSNPPPQARSRHDRDRHDPEAGLNRGEDPRDRPPRESGPTGPERGQPGGKA